MDCILVHSNKQWSTDDVEYWDTDLAQRVYYTEGPGNVWSKGGKTALRKEARDAADKGSNTGKNEEKGKGKGKLEGKGKKGKKGKDKEEWS